MNKAMEQSAKVRFEPRINGLNGLVGFGLNQNELLLNGLNGLPVFLFLSVFYFIF